MYVPTLANRRRAWLVQDQTPRERAPLEAYLNPGVAARRKGHNPGAPIGAELRRFGFVEPLEE